MKKHLCLFILLLLALALPCALADATVPQEVLDLCATAHPGYTVAAADGAAGQYALVLTNGSENRLCIAEREAGGDYALTIDKPTALRQGADIPELLIDTAGDALFYTYHGGEDGQYEYAEYTYHAVKQNGAWGTVDMTMRYSHEELAAWVQDGKLCRSVSRFDKEDNLFRQNIYLPMPLAGLDDQLTLADFDISLLPTSEYANPPEAMIRAALSLPEDAALERTLHGPYLFAEYFAPDGTRRVAACSYDEKDGYRTVSSQPLPEGWILDDFHSWSKMNISNFMDITCAFALYCNSAWKLAWVQTDELFSVFPNAIIPSIDDTILYAGDLPDFDLSTVDLADLPKSQAEVFAAMDSTNWRVVNNPIPTDRLRLRDAPGGKELGRYYNGTPVQVLGEEGEWSHVRIGHVEGYMMTAYLAPGDQGVEVRGVQLSVREELVGQDIPLYTQPDESSAVVAQVYNPGHMAWDGELFCGTAGDGWIHVLSLRDGISGYIQEKYLWAGNG